jgi:hypothetical protein
MPKSSVLSKITSAERVHTDGGSGNGSLITHNLGNGGGTFIGNMLGTGIGSLSFHI